MKWKILILILGIFFLGGCFDYQELNDRAIIVGLAIDYENEEYVVNFEVLNSKKSSSEQNSSNKSYLVEGKGETFSEAYQDALFSIHKDAYLAHLKAVVFCEEIAKDHLDSVVDYLIRDPSTRNVFYPVIASDVSAKTILSSNSEQTPVVAEAIEGLIDYNNYKETVTTTMNFERFLELLFNNHQDTYANVITLKDDKTLSVNGLGIFHEYKLVGLLDLEEASTSLLLNNKNKNFYVKAPCQGKTDKYLTINLYDSKTSYEVTDKMITLKGSYQANIMDDECSYNFKDTSLYSTLEQQFKTILEKDLSEAIKHYMQLNSDILGIQQAYYIKNRKPLPNWNQLNIKSEVALNINKNGIVFEVDGR